MPNTNIMMNMLRACIRFLASSLWASTISLPLPAGTTLIFGVLLSSGLLYTRTSCNSSFGRRSAMALASIDLPVPGVPSIITCRRWVAAFLTTSTACSWPITWSIRSSGTWISAVDSISSPPRRSSVDPESLSLVSATLFSFNINM